MAKIVVQRISPRPSPPGLAAFEDLVGWCFRLSSWRLAEPQRPHWQNYAATLGLAAVRAAASTTVMMRNFHTQGVCSVTREVVELTCRFVDVLELENKAWMSAVCSDISHLERIRNETDSTFGPWLATIEAQLRLQEARKAELKAAGIKGVQEEKTMGVQLGPHGKGAYAYLCLGTHNNVTPLLSSYHRHWSTDLLDPNQQEPVHQLQTYLEIAVNALSVGLTRYLKSHLFPDDQRDSHLAQLEELTRIFRNSSIDGKVPA